MKIVAFAGWSGSGKTNLIIRLIKYLKNNHNLNISTLKHAHKSFEVDKPNKDSNLHRKAGAKEVLISSSQRWVLMHELIDEIEPEVESLIERVNHTDILFVEGWKTSKLKKIEVYRDVTKKPLLYKKDKNIVAVATNNTSININKKIEALDIDDTSSIANFILKTKIFDNQKV